MRHWINILLATGSFIAGNFLFSEFLYAGIRRTYGLSKDSELLILGHSHVMLALNADMLERGLNMPVSKYTREGVTIAERKLMAEQYLAEHKDGKLLRYVIYGVDPYLFNSAGLSEYSYVNFYPMIGDPVIAPYLRKNIPSGEYCKLRLLPLCRFQDPSLYSGLAGWVKKSGASFKTGKVDLVRTRTEIERGMVRKITIQPEGLEIFRQTIRLFTTRGVRVILLNTPMIDLYNRLEPQAHAEVEKIYKAAAKDPLVEYWDLSRAYEHDYKLFRDPIHLNREGQSIVTGALIEKLRNEIVTRL